MNAPAIALRGDMRAVSGGTQPRVGAGCCRAFPKLDDSAYRCSAVEADVELRGNAIAIAAVIPVKRLAHAKSRLAGRLSPRDRAGLVLALLERAVSALETSGVVESIAVVTPEPDVARRVGTVHIADSGSLNGSLSNAATWAISEGCGGLLVLPGDLPLVSPDDICDLVGLQSPGVTIAPTHDGGTGALLLIPPDAISPGFGHDSFARHVGWAQERGIPVRTFNRTGFACDLDTADDLERFRSVIRPATRSSQR